VYKRQGIDRSGRQLPPNVRLCLLDFAAADWPSAMLSELYRHNIGHLTVEGGAKVLSSLLAAGLWDEARIITAAAELGSGLPAPPVSGQRQQTLWLADDRIDYFFRTSLGERQA
jgi:riboflavin biosynthesis pyrimidine reductase